MFSLLNEHDLPVYLLFFSPDNDATKMRLFNSGFLQLFSFIYVTSYFHFLNFLWSNVIKCIIVINRFENAVIDLISSNQLSDSVHIYSDRSFLSLFFSLAFLSFLFSSHSVTHILNFYHLQLFFLRVLCILSYFLGILSVFSHNIFPPFHFCF